MPNVTTETQIRTDLWLLLKITTAFAIAGTLLFNPMTDYLENEAGEKVKLDEPKGIEFPPMGFAVEDNGYQEPAKDGSEIEISVNPESKTFAAFGTV